MVDPPPFPPGDDTGVAPDDDSANVTPRWVKVFGIIATILILLFLLLHLNGMGLGGH